VAQLFANAAAGVLGMVRTVEQLTEALATRRTIGQAMGIVMERYTIDDEQAFRFLTRLSQTTNTNLRLVAEDLVRGALSRAHSIDLPKRADRTD
jgi:AmiR/NasT family two-component response regulator